MRPVGDGTLPLLPSGPVGGARRWPALLLVFILFAAGWGEGLLRAVLYLVGAVQPTVSPWTRSLQDITELLVVSALLITAAITGAARYNLTPATLGLTRPRSRWDWQCEAGLFAAAVLLPAISFGLGAVLTNVLGLPDGIYPRPANPGAWYATGSLLSSALAGVNEEIVLLAFTVAVLRRAQFSWRAVIITAAVLRVSFHIYYGVGSIFLAVWAVGMVLLYARHGRVLGAIVGHSLWDLAADTGTLSGTPIPQFCMYGAAVICLVVAVRAGVFSRPRFDATPARAQLQNWLRPRRGTLLAGTALAAFLIPAATGVLVLLTIYPVVSQAIGEAHLGNVDAWSVSAFFVASLLALAAVTVLASKITPPGLSLGDTRAGLTLSTASAAAFATTLITALLL
ncbi:type II CAAX prenyl endopeptidase Rce1 family protein [Kineococcus sp. R86509]|uniref:CPBP family glutamic-type intramembrane protease n=1 Tax=Kineococcus sp. R86509 TaxID=3093851 RepID=UPI0036D3EE7B